MILSLLLVCAPNFSLSPTYQDSLKDEVEMMKEIISGRKREEEAIQLMDGFVQRYLSHQERLLEIEDSLEIEIGVPKDLKKERKSIQKEQDLLAKTVWVAFSRKRETAENQQLWTAAAYSFGQMSSHGSEYLWKAFEDRRFNKDIKFQGLCVEQVGFTRDWGQAESLVDLLDYKHETVAAKAAESLAKFREAPLETRQDCVKKLVKLFESYRSRGVDLDDSNGQRVYRIIREPFLRALSELTGQSLRTSLEWTKWWNNNKKNKDAWQ
jgi:hypothetical protein